MTTTERLVWKKRCPAIWRVYEFLRTVQGLDQEASVEDRAWVMICDDLKRVEDEAIKT